MMWPTIISVAIALFSAGMGIFIARRHAQDRQIIRPFFNQVWLNWHGKHSTIAVVRFIYGDNRKWVCTTCGAERSVRRGR